MAMLKGNLMIGQSGGPTAVINASLAGVIQAARTHARIQNIYGMVHGIEGALGEELYDLTHEPPETIELLRSTPSSILGSCRHKLSDAEYLRILEVFQAHNVRHFIYIGGNDSMDTCHRVSQLAQEGGYEIQVIGVPKTVDNDLARTDHTPGYGSAARFIALATRDTGRDLEAMETFDDVSILETMGRNAGWLAAASVLGKSSESESPNLVYVPEVPFDEGDFLESVVKVHDRLGRVFVVVCEGVRDQAGHFIGQPKAGETQKDAFGHTLATLTTGVAAYLADLVTRRTRLRARFLRPVLIGRALSECVADTDRSEAYAAGNAAVEHLAQGESGVMMGFKRLSNKPYSVAIEPVPLADVANAEKLLPREFINPAGNQITEAFVEYALPLIDGPLPPLARLTDQRVKQVLV